MSAVSSTFWRVLQRSRDAMFWGAVTGAIVYGISYLSFDQPFSWIALLYSAGIGTVYVLSMGGFMHASKRLVDRLIPLRSKGAVLIHTISQSLSMLISFIVTTAFLKMLLGRYFSVHWQFMLIVALVAFSAALIGHSFSYMHRFHRRMREAERAQHTAEMNALRAQINPHFLFNAFNSIAALIRSRPGEAEAVVEDLADLFRYTLRASKQEATTLAGELDAARLYLEIEGVRFQERMQVNIDVPEDLRSARLPSMTLQPLVENAVKHGVSQTDTPCIVTVEACQRDDTLCVHVTDSGPGFDTDDVDEILERGTGLANVRDRLRLFFDDAARLTILPQGVEVCFPYQPDVDTEHATLPVTAVSNA